MEEELTTPKLTPMEIIAAGVVGIPVAASGSVWALFPLALGGGLVWGLRRSGVAQRITDSWYATLAGQGPVGEATGKLVRSLAVHPSPADEQLPLALPNPSRGNDRSERPFDRGVWAELLNDGREQERRAKEALRRTRKLSAEEVEPRLTRKMSREELDLDGLYLDDGSGTHDGAVRIERLNLMAGLKRLLDEQALIVLGPKGSGKTTLGLALLNAAVAKGWQVGIIDPHGSKNPWPRGIRVLGTRTNYEEADAALVALYNEMRRRYDEDGDDEPLVVFIDEVPSLREECPSWERVVPKLLREARKVNIHVVVLSQSFLVSDLGLNSASRTNFTVVALGKAISRYVNEAKQLSQTEKQAIVVEARGLERAALIDDGDLPVLLDPTGADRVRSSKQPRVWDPFEGERPEPVRAPVTGDTRPMRAPAYVQVSAAREVTVPKAVPVPAPVPVPAEVMKPADFDLLAVLLGNETGNEGRNDSRNEAVPGVLMQFLVDAAKEGMSRDLAFKAARAAGFSFRTADVSWSEVKRLAAD